jgi:hypothetical protein
MEYWSNGIMEYRVVRKAIVFAEKGSWGLPILQFIISPLLQYSNFLKTLGNQPNA